MNNILPSLKGAWGTIFAVLMVVLFVASSMTLYKLDVQRLSSRMSTIEMQNNSAVEARRAADMRDILVLLEQKKKVEAIEKNITKHQEQVDKTQKEILELLKEMKEAHKRIEGKLK
jgi:peptidoglycan hydrolase CwlO-like protein